MTVALSIIAAAAALGALGALLALARARGDRRRRAEEASERAAAAAVAEERRRETLEALPLAALRVDARGRVLEANGAARAAFPSLAPGATVLEAFGEHRLAHEAAAATASLAPRTFEVRLFSGGRRTYRAAVRPHRAGGEVEALLLLTDSSEAVAYQELRSQFVANVSHELRTPLTGLRGLLEALGDPAMDAGTRGEFAGRAAREAQRLEALISDILLLSELEATQGLPSDAVSDLARAVPETAGDLAAEAERRGVRLEARPPAGPAWTPLTEGMSATVARNLIENAVRYAGHGAVARADVTAGEGWVRLVVSDDGAGIPERHLPHVFERFYRADPSRSRRLGGTGLGLSIVKHIAERVGGRVEATSREGFGTTVTVVLPAAPAPGRADAGPAANARTGG